LRKGAIGAYYPPNKMEGRMYWLILAALAIVGAPVALFVVIAVFSALYAILYTIAAKWVGRQEAIDRRTSGAR